MDTKLKHLLKLLDDENQQTASLAMAELVKYEELIDPILRKMQESGDVRMRRRIHQLQSILTIKKRRKNLTFSLKSENPDLIRGLSELHLQWYDNDAETLMTQYWNELLESAKKYNINSIERLASFMHKSGFNVSNKDDIDADFYCLGIVFEDLTGADFILAVIAKCLAAQFGLELKIIQLIGDFALINARGQILLPKNGWRLTPNINIKKEHFREWTDSMILRFDASLLFMCAISSDCFRYVNTIGTCLAKTAGHNNLNFLPYPYNSEK